MRLLPLFTVTLWLACPPTAAVAGPSRAAPPPQAGPGTALQAVLRPPAAPGRVLRDVTYGPDPAQRLDAYLPAQARGAPMLLLVHGGGWRRGDKAMASVVDAKVARWVPRGVAVVSIDYPMLPGADALAQAHHVARALAFVQAQARTWGADPARLVLMGHSAGAHLVALVAASPALAAQAGARPPLGAVLLDSAALDVPRVMRARHFGFYDAAFGTDPAGWRAASPWHALAGPVPPVLAVCSTRRADACPQADAYATRVRTLGGRAEVLREDLSHREINARLGTKGAYTQAVEAFLARLAPAFAAAPDRPHGASP